MSSITHVAQATLTEPQNSFIFAKSSNFPDDHRGSRSFARVWMAPPLTSCLLLPPPLNSFASPPGSALSSK